jgi:hypothetical protein
MKLLFGFALLLATGVAQAQLANLPDFTNPLQVGRVRLYPSVQPYSWLVPTAFRSEFNCTSANSEFRTCTISVYNELSESEQSELDRLIEQQGLNVVPVSDLDDRVVSQIQEQFELPLQIDSQTRSLRSLALSSGKFAYASSMFRVKRELAAELLQRYQSSGLGAFKVNFLVHGQRPETYLAVKNGICLQQRLAEIKDGLSLSALNRILEKTLTACGVVATNFAADEVAPYAKVQLRAAFFDYNLWSGFSLRRQELQRIGPSYVMARSVEPVRQLRCQATLPLLQSALVATDCQEVK